jgi:hypothetical protein
LETTRETSASRIAATPAKIRECGWNHMVSPNTMSSPLMTSDPAPAVVAIRMVSSPKVMCA